MTSTKFISIFSPLFVVWLCVQALGGLVVGLVTKYAGGVVKGFALIAGEYAANHSSNFQHVSDVLTHCPTAVLRAGIVTTGVAQWFFENKPLGQKDL